MQVCHCRQGISWKCLQHGYGPTSLMWNWTGMRMAMKGIVEKQGWPVSVSMICTGSRWSHQSLDDEPGTERHTKRLGQEWPRLGTRVCRRCREASKGHEQTLALDGFSIFKPGVAMIQWLLSVVWSNFAVLPRISLGFWRHRDHQVDNLQDMVDEMQEHIHASIVPEQEIMGEKGCLV